MPCKSTPWGKADGVKRYADGIEFYSTPSHGGFKLDRVRNAKMPDYMRRAGGWYEEDSEWSLVCLVYPDAFTPESQKQAHDTARNWYPDEYQRFTGTTLTAADSYKLAEREFAEQARDKLVVTAAWGDWHEAVPKGMVGVVACLGARRDQPASAKCWFNVPATEYAGRSVFGFVIDPARHAHRAPIA